MLTSRRSANVFLPLAPGGHYSLSNGQHVAKILDGEAAAQLAEGDYESQKALEAHIPDCIVHPLAWGRLQESNNGAFFLADFVTLQASPPSLPELLGILKTLHQSPTSPNGKFGFHVTTFFGASPMRNEWTDTWEEFFTREFRSNLEWAQRERGRQPGLDDATEQFVEKVIPRLLRPLETGDRSIRPTLCHGDLWDGNIQVDVDRNRPVIFDACCFYGHSESGWWQDGCRWLLETNKTLSSGPAVHAKSPVRNRTGICRAV